VPVLAGALAKPVARFALLQQLRPASRYPTASQAPVDSTGDHVNCEVQLSASFPELFPGPDSLRPATTPKPPASKPTSAVRKTHPTVIISSIRHSWTTPCPNH